MSIILNFNLSQIATSISSCICLFDPEPSFQYVKDANFQFSIIQDMNLIRDSTPLSTYPATIISNITGLPTGEVINLPVNSYALNLPSQVYGTPPSGDTFSVLQINTALALIEPGFSRLMVTYSTTQNQNIQEGNIIFPEYFDCPFYEGFNDTAKDLQNVVDYIEESIGFLQSEINILNYEIDYALSREFWRGTSVSGQITATPVTSGLQTDPSQFPTKSLPGCAITTSEKGFFESATDEKGFPTLQPGGGEGLSATQLLTALTAAGTSNGILIETAYATPGSYTYGYMDNTANGTNNANAKGAWYIGENVNGTVTFLCMDNNQLSQQLNINIPVTVKLGGVTKNIDPKITNGNITASTDSGISNWYSTNSGFISYDTVNVIGQGGSTEHVYRAVMSPGTALVGASVTIGNITGNSNTSGVSIGNDTTTYGSFTILQGASGPLYIQGTKTDSATMTVGAITGFPITDVNNGTRAFSITSNSNATVASAAISGSGANGTLTMTAHVAGSTTVTITDGNNTATLTLTVSAAPPPGTSTPTITSTSLAGNTGCVRVSFTVNGTGFLANTTATINGVSAPFTDISSTQGKLTIPAATPGLGNITLYNGTLASAPFSFTVIGDPLITGISPSSIQLFDNVIITGQNFGNAGGTIYSIQPNGTPVPIPPGWITSWTDSIIKFTPQVGAPGTYQIEIDTVCGYSGTKNLVVASADTLIISPTTVTVPLNIGFQFAATFSAGGGPSQNVTSSPYTSWFVNGVQGGSDEFGYVSQQGYYIAPAFNPNTTITVTVQYLDVNSSSVVSETTLSASATVGLAASPELVLSPTNSTVPGGGTVQYTATMFFSGFSGPSEDVTNSSAWSVNNSPGGDILDGIINSDGFYTSPGHLLVVTVEQISASFVYLNQTYTAFAEVTVGAVLSNVSNITVTSQLNIYLGDGRYGYVPRGTQFVVQSNQYVYVQFTELLDVNLLPIATFMPVQLLSLSGMNAFSPNITNTMYNMANRTLNSNGTINSQRTIVLGIIDPTDGLFHSIWDIAKQLPLGIASTYTLDSKDIDKTDDSTAQNCILVGTLLVQWGEVLEQYKINEKSTISDTITFPKQYTISCSVLTEAKGDSIISKAINVNKENFDIKLTNIGDKDSKTSISWIAIGT